MGIQSLVFIVIFMVPLASCKNDGIIQNDSIRRGLNHQKVRRNAVTLPIEALINKRFSQSPYWTCRTETDCFPSSDFNWIDQSTESLIDYNYRPIATPKIGNNDDNSDLSNFQWFPDSKDVQQKKVFATPRSECDCVSVNSYKDLGPNSFPRSVSTKICQHTCSNKQSCVPIIYTLRVLTRCNDTKGMGNNLYFEGLPEELKSCWKYRNVNVTTGCKCASHSHCK